MLKISKSCRCRCRYSKGTMAIRAPSEMKTHSLFFTRVQFRARVLCCRRQYRRICGNLQRPGRLRHWVCEGKRMCCLDMDSLPPKWKWVSDSRFPKNMKHWQNVPILLLRKLRNLCWLVKTDKNKGDNIDWVRGPPCNSKGQLHQHQHQSYISHISLYQS